MKCCRYRDGSYSREIEEDWEATGQDEMNEIYAECKEKRSVLNVRDRLNNINDLVTVCHEALTISQLYDIKRIVGDVLHFQVNEQLKIAEQELNEIWIPLK